MKDQIIHNLPAECPWWDTLYWYDTIDSTNTRAKAMAAADAPHGTVLVAGAQTGGRGRMGRSFSSEADMGAYLSVILRPGCAGTELMHLTCAAAVAMCDAVETVAGIRPGIKWTNDLVWQGKKLGGILTELSLEPGSSRVAYAVVGIGINCRQKREDFPPELQDMAVSASAAAGKSISPAAMAAAMIDALYHMDKALLTAKQTIMTQYRENCITLGKEVSVVRGNEITRGTALDVDADGALVVDFGDGRVSTVTSGEVSIRGLYGYV